MQIESNTIRFILFLLSDNYEQIWTKRVGNQRENQVAYYNGMKIAVEMMLSNVYKTEIHIDVDGEGKHTIREFPLEDQNDRTDEHEQAS